MPVLSTLGGGSKKGFSGLGSGAAAVIDASGGTTEEYTDQWGDKWKSHTYSTAGTYTFTVNSIPSTDQSIKSNNALRRLEILIVGGGGGGAGGHDADWYGGGGGGAGGVVLKANYTPSEGSNSIVVGAGGSGGNGAGTGQNQDYASKGNNGSNSSAFGYQGVGGGGGGRSHSAVGDAQNGGSGGGKGSSTNWNDCGKSNQTHYYSSTITDGYSTGADWRGSYGGNGYDGGSYPFGGGGGGAMGCGAPVHDTSNQNFRCGGAGGLPIALKFQNNTQKSYAAGGGGGGAGNCSDSSGGEGGWGMGHGNHTTRSSNSGGDGTGNGCGTGGRREGGDATNGFGHGGGGGGGGPAGGTADGAGSGGDGGTGCVIIRYIIEENANGAWRADNSYYDGSSSAKAAECARDIDTHTSGTPSNDFYWIKPQWYPGNPFQIYCNFSCDGGNWMRYAVGASHNTPGGNNVMLVYDAFTDGSNNPMNTSRSYDQSSFSRFDISKYHKNISTRDDATDSQMMWRRINNANAIMIHNIPQKVFQRNGAFHKGQNQNYSYSAVESVATSSASSTNGGYSPFLEDGCEISGSWPCWNDDMLGDGAGGCKINLMKHSNSGEGSLVNRSTSGSNPYPCRYETGPGYSGIAWNSGYGNNQDNAGGFNNFMNRRALVYWETNGVNSSQQWFHGTVLSMNVSSGPYASRNHRDIEVYFRPTLS